jgi:hypothetical protein
MRRICKGVCPGRSNERLFLATFGQYHQLNMETMSLWRLILNNPEWIAVFASVIFAIATLNVMIWQVRVSTRHERIQNRLIRLQHEHSWMLQLNEERETLLNLARKLHLAAGCLKSKHSISDPLHWTEVVHTTYELDSRLKILDMDAFTGENDNWFPNLTRYVEAVLKAIVDDSRFYETFELPSDSPNLTTRKALKDAEQRYEIIKVFLDLEGAIRMEFFDFKKKWDSLMS